MDIVSVRRKKRKRKRKRKSMINTVHLPVEIINHPTFSINTVHLPMEIITDILLRLPFDSILNCKLVSTEWKNIIHHPNFSINYKGYTNSMCLFTDYDRLLCLRIRHDNNNHLTKAGNPGFTIHQVPIAIDLRINPGIYYTHLSNGIACVLKDKFFYFYNLIIGSPALHTVTNSPLPQHRSFRWKHFGFGYDSYGDEYKIVLAGHCKPEHPKAKVIYAAYADKTQYWVYSFKNRGWKSFNDFPYSACVNDCYRRYSSGTTVNGVLHWLVPRHGVMVTYDLHTGVFGEIRLPGAGVNEVGNELAYCGNFSLQEVGGKLCYTYYRKESKAAYLLNYAANMPSYSPRMLDMWRMVGDDWEMLASINCDCASGNISWLNGDNPKRPLMLHESVDGRMLILLKDLYKWLPRLSWYDFVNNACESFSERVWHQERILNKR